jgi:hypothetical protein
MKPCQNKQHLSGGFEEQGLREALQMTFFFGGRDVRTLWWRICRKQRLHREFGRTDMDVPTLGGRFRRRH